MRYIDLKTLLKKRKSWGKRKDLWKNKSLIKDFRDYGFNKCWYTEVELLGQDPHIDHWRPKAKIKQYKQYKYNKRLKHGYSWLSGEPNNYRLCCVYANRKTGNGGKSCYFPLSDNSGFLTPTGKQKEKPLLIDPCKKNDVKLITFLGGSAMPAMTSSLKQQKANVSIEIYNINNPYIKDSRQRLWDNVKKTLDEYKFKKITFDVCVSRLQNAIDRRSQFSACAIACILSLAPKRITNKLNPLLAL